MKREVRPLRAFLFGWLIAALLVFVAPAALGNQGNNDPGSGCNGEAAPGPDCRPDPQPDHGKDCEAHGNNQDGNEDHCTTPSPTPSPTVEPTPTPTPTPPNPTPTPTVDPTPTPTTPPTVAPSPTPSTPTAHVPKHPKPGLAQTGLSAVWYLSLAALGLLLVAAGLALRRVR